MTRYNKAIAAVVSAAVSVLATQNISVGPELQAAIVTILTSAAVYIIPNRNDV